jgi:predicted  nucleic acid-binding Zn-ribbon protein
LYDWLLLVEGDNFFHPHPKKFWSGNDICQLCTMQGSIAQSELTVALSKLVQTIEVLAQAAAESEYFPSALEQLDINGTGHIAASMHWQDFQIESALSNLIRVANNLLQGKTEIVNFIVELAIALNSVMAVGDFCSLKQQVNDSVNERIASTTDLEIAKEEIANFEEELQMARAERAAFESHVQAELERFTDIESQIDHLSSEKRDLELSLSEANQQVKDLKEQLQEVEILLEDYRRQEVSESFRKFRRCKMTIKTDASVLEFKF